MIQLETIRCLAPISQR